MADPTPITIDPAVQQKIIEQIQKQKEATDELLLSQDALVKSNQLYDKSLDDLLSSAKDFTSQITTSGFATEKQTVQFTALGSAMLGVTKSYEHFGQAIDKDNMSLFGDKINNVTKALGSGAVAMNFLVNVAKSMGHTIGGDVMKGGIGAVKKYVESLVDGADNTKKFTNALLQMSAGTGQLGNLYQLAGDKLENLNAVTTQQMALVASVSAANNINTETTTKYYGELSKIPQAVNAQALAINGAHKNMELFDASIKLAVGTGQSYSKVVDGMAASFRNYGKVGTEALNFVSKISEVSNTVGGDLNQVGKILTDMSDKYKYIGENTNSAAQALQNYTKALKESGVATGPALELAALMINKVQGLTLAQKALISQQSGGPGGLLGGLKLEQQMQSGDMAGVMEKMRSSLTRQLGPILNLNDATKNPTQASQFVRQREIVKNQFGVDDSQANKILDALKKSGSGGLKKEDMDKLGLSKSIDRGSAIQEKTYTAIDRLNHLIEQAQVAKSAGALTFVEEALTNKPALKTSREDATDLLSQVNRQNADSVKAGRANHERSGSGLMIASVLSKLEPVFKSIPNEMKDVMKTSVKYLRSGDATKADANMNDIIAKSKEGLRQDEEARRNLMKNSKGNKAQLDVVNNKISGHEAEINLAQQVKDAIAQQQKTDALSPAQGSKTGATQTQHQHRVEKNNAPQQVEVTVKGVCIDCGRTMDETTAQQSALNPSIPRKR